MYYQYILMPDGTRAGPPDLAVRNPHLEFTAQRRRDVALTSRYCDWSERKSLVFAKNSRILATVYGGNDWAPLIDFAKVQLRSFYDVRKWQHPTQGVVALLHPFPDIRLDSLESVGVDTIYTPKRLEPDAKGNEEMRISHWLRTLATQHGKWPRIFVLPPDKSHMLY